MPTVTMKLQHVHPWIWMYLHVDDPGCRYILWYGAALLGIRIRMWERSV